MEILWTEPAMQDVEVIYEYIAEHNENAAEIVETSILKAVKRLTEFPRRGRPGRRTGTRELVISDLPYTVVYKESDVITVLRILHQSQDWKK